MGVQKTPNVELYIFYLLEQLKPSPENPGRQLQVKLPSVLKQEALLSHVLVSVELHSSTSGERKRESM